MMKNRSELFNGSGIIKKVRTKAVIFVTAFFIPAFVLSSLSFTATAASENMSLEQRIRHLEELNQTRNKVQADLTYQLSELQREIRSLTGQVEDNNFKLKQIQERQRDLYRDIENRLSGLTGSGSDSANITNRAAAVSTRKPNTSKPVAATNDPSGELRREFEAAFALVRNKDYSSAISAFTAFLNKHPSSSYSANSRFWMGQVYLVQNKSDEAAKQFSALISEFPSSTKVGAAKLKLADIYVKQKNWADAKRLYSEVSKSGSNTQQQLARNGLQKVKQAGD